MKYIIVDLSYRGMNLDDVELDDDWYVDDEDDVCYECESVHQFVANLMYNIEEYFDAECLDNIEEVQKDLIAELIEWDYCEINGFGYFIER